MASSRSNRRNAFSSESRDSIRSRYAVVTSTQPASPDSSRASSFGGGPAGDRHISPSWTEIEDCSDLFENRGNEKTLAVTLRRIRQRFVSRQRRRRFVVSKDVRHFDRMGHRLDFIGVDFIQNRHVVEQFGQLPRERSLFGCTEFETRQRSRLGNLLTVPSRFTLPVNGKNPASWGNRVCGIVGDSSRTAQL